MVDVGRLEAWSTAVKELSYSRRYHGQAFNNNGAVYVPDTCTKDI